jgi:hypothetical protein
MFRNTKPDSPIFLDLSNLVINTIEIGSGYGVWLLAIVSEVSAFPTKFNWFLTHQSVHIYFEVTR